MIQPCPRRGFPGSISRYSRASHETTQAGLERQVHRVLTYVRTGTGRLKLREWGRVGEEGWEGYCMVQFEYICRFKGIFDSVAIECFHN